ncbi:MAG TPA: SDR family NAD(P)-dependent oxidoreductase, partial [Kofleriaceae bacterium]|nr:SDR family NAD(P)-dependent oxidoreductase [Kofleriaceae bacterium]
MRVFVTGATGGIGRELVRGLVIAGAEIIVGCRDVARAAGFGPRVRAYALDLASLASVRDAVRRADTELPALDALVNAAGVWPRQRRTTSDGLELAFGTNHVAHHALTIGLLPVLRRARMPRVITVASGLHVRGKLAWDDLQQARGGFNGVRAYEQSKLANVMFALALARRMGDALASNAIHPGIVRTNLTREYPEMLRDVAP